MPKIIELTVEIEIQRVSCPGVWLCQDGRVSLTVFALGTSYQTCLLPPMFPLMFKDIFYFRKRFQETCAVNNICCLLKDETIYCELVQWCNDCTSGECSILAQYLGALNDVLFPPNTCCNDGVDLLMRRSKEFPGILSPKIEIATKVRIDEVWNQPCSVTLKTTSCHCADAEGSRQRQVCHTAQYHRTKCNSSHKRPPSTARSRSRSRSRSGGSRSCCSFTPKVPEINITCECPSPAPKPRQTRRSPSRRPKKCPEYYAYNVETKNTAWLRNNLSSDRLNIDGTRSNYDLDKLTLPNEDRLQKIILESRYVDDVEKPKEKFKRARPKVSPCVCEICKRYHELFHSS